MNINSSRLRILKVFSIGLGMRYFEEIVDTRGDGVGRADDPYALQIPLSARKAIRTDVPQSFENIFDAWPDSNTMRPMPSSVMTLCRLHPRRASEIFAVCSVAPPYQHVCVASTPSVKPCSGSSSVAVRTSIPPRFSGSRNDASCRGIDFFLTASSDFLVAELVPDGDVDFPQEGPPKKINSKRPCPSSNSSTNADELQVGVRQGKAVIENDSFHLLLEFLFCRCHQLYAFLLQSCIL